MTIYNIRGPCGAGKSTLVRTVLDCVRRGTQSVMAYDVQVGGSRRRNPIGYVHQGRRLFIAGHYEREAMGGIDSFTSLEEAYGWISKYAGFGFDVLFEGKCQERDIPHLRSLAERWPVVAVCIGVRLEQAIDGVRKRASANAIRAGVIERSLRKYRRDTDELDSDELFTTIKVSRSSAFSVLEKELRL